jgi:hypothetical protein
MVKSGSHVKGFFRLQLGEDENGKQKVVGDSGWIENTITEHGFDDYIVGAVGNIANSSQISNMQIATQTDAMVSTQNSLSGEVNARKTTSNTLSGNGTLVCTAQWSSDDNTDGPVDIGAVGLYEHVTTGSLACGELFTTSTWATNQNLSATYELRFSE